MTKPRITKAEALKFIAETPIEEVYLIGIRGYYQDTMGKPGVNDRGIYDDAICLVAPSLFLTFNSNTDPSIFRPGIATLIPGKHTYKKGKHKISGPHPYPALRPATPDESLPVTRDGKEGVSKGIAINIHKGSYNSTSSEGCQTIYPDQWQEFIDAVYAQMDQHGQHTIPYYLVEFKQFAL
jgi:lysozyme